MHTLLPVVPVRASFRSQQYFLAGQQSGRYSEHVLAQGVHVDNAYLQKIDVQYFDKTSKFNFQQIRHAQRHTLLRVVRVMLEPYSVALVRGSTAAPWRREIWDPEARYEKESGKRQRKRLV